MFKIIWDIIEPHIEPILSSIITAIIGIIVHKKKIYSMKDKVDKATYSDNPKEEVRKVINKI